MIEPADDRARSGRPESEGDRHATSSVAADPVASAVNVYYWKPLMAIFRAVEASVYRRAGVVLEGPVLDLGCGEGRAARLLQTVDVVTAPPLGLDMNTSDLEDAARVGAHSALVRGDAHRLPFADASLAAVFANGVICCIPAGAPPAVAEAARVLRPGGVFAMTVATDRFDDVLPIARLIARFSPSLAATYCRRLNARMTHHTKLSAEGWRELLVTHGLEVVREEPFFARRAAAMWNIATLQVVRLWSVTRLLGDLIGHERAARLAAKLLLPLAYRAEAADRKAEPPFGYLLLVARKPET